MLTILENYHPTVIAQTSLSDDLRLSVITVGKADGFLSS